MVVGFLRECAGTTCISAIKVSDLSSNSVYSEMWHSEVEDLKIHICNFNVIKTSVEGSGVQN